MLIISDEKFDQLIATMEKIGTESLSPADFIGIGAAFISAVSVGLAYYIYWGQQRTERRRYTAQLHDFYWSEDFKRIRESVYASRARWKTKSANEQDAILVYLSTHKEDDAPPPEWSAIARLIFFFSDLDRYIDKEIVDKELSLEMFGNAQYEWFRDYIGAIRLVVEQSHGKSGNPPSWIARTKSLEAKIDQFERDR
jgi:hypothetical protein